MLQVVLATSVALLLSAPCASGHGRLIEPPSRASAWRYGFSTPHNYNDHELYCGGFTRQWNRNGGKCGVCGDAWDTKVPRAHEYGGVYGQGVVVRNYGIGSVITIRVELTASHMGHFTFTVCDDYKNATQECLDKHALKILRPQDNVERGDVRYYPKDGNKVYEMKYRLPAQFSCAHCLLQWRYIAGNNWGTCADGTGAVGCGPQEEFRACADISVGKHPTPTIPDLPTRPTTSVPTSSSTTTTSTATPPTSDDTSYSPVTSLVIALVCFVIALLVVAALFVHYYKVGKQIKLWLLRKSGKTNGAHNNSNSSNGGNMGGEKPPALPPMPPPRTKRTRSISETTDNMQEISLDKDLP